MEHASHKIKSQGEAKEQLVAEMQVELASMNKVKPSSNIVFQENDSCGLKYLNNDKLLFDIL